MIFQDDCLFPHLSVAANIRFGSQGLAVLARRPASPRWPRCAAWSICSNDVPKRSLAESGSGSACATLAPRRELYYAMNRSPHSTSQTAAHLNRLRAVQREEGIPMLYVTHSPAEAIALGSRLFLFKEGRIVARGAAAGHSRKGPYRIARIDRLGGHPQRLPRARRRSRTRERSLNRLPRRWTGFDHPVLGHSPGTRVQIEIGADDIILTRQPVGVLSARNQIAGTVEQIIRTAPMPRSSFAPTA